MYCIFKLIPKVGKKTKSTIVFEVCHILISVDHQQVNKHKKETYVRFVMSLFHSKIVLYLSSPAGVHIFAVLLVKRISLCINPLNNKLFEFVFKADVIE